VRHGDVEQKQTFSSAHPSNTVSVDSVTTLTQLCRKEIHNAVYSLGQGSYGTFLICSELHAVNKTFMNTNQSAAPHSRHGLKLSTTAAHVALTSGCRKEATQCCRIAYRIIS